MQRTPFGAHAFWSARFYQCNDTKQLASLALKRDETIDENFRNCVEVFFRKLLFSFQA